MQLGNDPSIRAHRFETARAALAAAITGGVAYLACAAFVAIAPGMAIQMLGWLTHVTNLDQIAARGVTAGGLVAGLLQVLVYVYLVVGLFGITFNALARRARSSAASRTRRFA